MTKSLKLLAIASICGALLSACNPTEPPKPFQHVAKRVAAKAHSGLTVETITLIPPSEISTFLGGKDFKLAFCRQYKLFVLEYANGSHKLLEISQGDEGPEGGEGRPSSPIFSPDGKWVAYSGSTGRNVCSFVYQLGTTSDTAWRLAIHVPGESRGEPHWVEQGGQKFVYVTDSPNSVKYDTVTRVLPGFTYKTELLSDSAVGAVTKTDLPGAFKGGFSRDGKWAFTSYATSVLYNMQTKVMTIFQFGPRLVQHCNPSINPFAAGSPRTDYSMLLGFGNPSELQSDYKSLVSVGNDTLYEAQHENIWIFNKDLKIVWQCKRTDLTKYYRWEKPEWSTHPEYATAVGIHRPPNDANGDLYVIKIGDLSNNDESALKQAEGTLQVGTGFGPSDWSHLWVAP